MKRQAILCFLLQLSFELFSCTHLRVIPGSTLELPCLPSHSDFAGADITWKFNGKDMLPSRQSSGSVTVKKNGLSLSISPVTAANEGDYECLVKDSNMELLRTYKIAVDAAIGYTIKVTEGGYVNLPCHFSPSSQFKANALWFKEPGVGTRTELNVTNDNGKLELLYPDSSDQTVLLRDTAMEDAGIYLCESAEGEKLSSVYLIVDAGPTPEPHSCTNFTSAWEPCLDVNIRIGEALLQESMTEFSMKLYSYLRELYPSTNLLFSPISISGVLSHLLLGARDDTRRAIESALRVPNDYHCVHLQTKKLRDKLSSSLQMASQIYYNPRITITV